MAYSLLSMPRDEILFEGHRVASGGVGRQRYMIELWGLFELWLGEVLDLLGVGSGYEEQVL